MARDLVRLSDVAKAAGVSQGTASNVFSRPDLVRPEVRERVQKTARDLGYAGPDPRGRLVTSLAIPLTPVRAPAALRPRSLRQP